MSISKMFGGSESQSLHIVTASISLKTRLTRGHRGNTLKTHRCHHHDVFHHASLGAAASSFCVNYTASFNAEILRSV